MKAEDIYKEIRKIAEPYHSYDDQMVAIARWMESKLNEKQQAKSFEIEYQNDSSTANGQRFIVREDVNYPHHYLIADGKSHVGGGTLLKQYCKKIAS